MAEPLLLFVAMGFGLGRFVSPIEGQSYVAFLAPGLVAGTAMYAAAFETTFGSYTRMAEQRTYEAIVMTPISVEQVVAGDILWAATKSVVGAAVFLAIMAATGLVDGPLALLLLPLAFVVGLAFGSMGMAFTALAPSYTFFNYFFTLVLGVMFFFGGVFFPLDGLPAWAVGAAWALPLTHAVALMRAVTTGALAPGLWSHAAVLVVFTAVAAWVAARLIRRRLIR